MHNPIQIADPEICSNFDFDQSIALSTRRTFIADHVDRDVLVLGTHFTTPAVGHIVREKDGMRFVAAEEQSDDQKSVASLGRSEAPDMDAAPRTVFGGRK